MRTSRRWLLSLRWPAHQRNGGAGDARRPFRPRLQSDLTWTGRVVTSSAAGGLSDRHFEGPAGLLIEWLLIPLQRLTHGCRVQSTALGAHCQAHLLSLEQRRTVGRGAKLVRRCRTPSVSKAWNRLETSHLPASDRPVTLSSLLSVHCSSPLVSPACHLVSVTSTFASPALLFPFPFALDDRLRRPLQPPAPYRRSPTPRSHHAAPFPSARESSPGYIRRPGGNILLHLSIALSYVHSARPPGLIPPRPSHTVISVLVSVLHPVDGLLIDSTTQRPSGIRGAGIPDHDN